MSPDYINKNVEIPAQITVTPKSSSESINNGCDNIITITTSSINDNLQNISSEIVAEQNKSYIKNNQTISNKLINLNKNTSQSSNIEHPSLFRDVNNPPTAKITTTTSCCKLSRFISQQENITNLDHRKGRRLHGLQLPLHPLQVLGWLVLIIFGFASYCILIPAFNADIQGPLYGLIIGLYFVHIVSHLVAVLLDPADRELRRVHRNDRIVPEFDRNKHSHVIENGRCHLCNIRCSSQRTKHCSVCNKCVGKFDHHCKWLNHCIGSRNYVAFLMCVVSAVIATLVIVSAVTAQLVLLYVQQAQLAASIPYNEPSAHIDLLYNKTIEANETEQFLEAYDVENSTNLFNITQLALDESIYFSTMSTLGSESESSTNNETIKNSIGISIVNRNTILILGIIERDSTAFLVLLCFLGILSAVTAGLLLHLCLFHVYISFLGLTTYEYIRNHRQAREANENTSSLPPRFNEIPSKKLNNCGQIYFCSSMQHPSTLDTSDSKYFNRLDLNSDKMMNSKVHCCTSSSNYHRNALKSYYICSLLDNEKEACALDISQHIRQNMVENQIDQNSKWNEGNMSKTFHCCSSFAATNMQRKDSAVTSKATLVTNLSDTAAQYSARRSYVHYAECTLCTYSIHSPIVKNRKNIKDNGTSSTQSTCSVDDCDRHRESSNKNSTNTNQENCCSKAISKQKIWRRKWNCCSSVPDSPDVPNSIVTSIKMHEEQEKARLSAIKNNSVSEMPQKFVKTVSGSVENTDSPKNELFKPPNNYSNRYKQTWPVGRMRRIIYSLGHTNNRLNNASKQNKVRPLQLKKNFGEHYNAPNDCYNCNFLQKSLTATSTLDENRESNGAKKLVTIETILPTSVIRDDNILKYATLPPALPPPTRRRIANSNSLDDFTEALGFVRESPTATFSANGGNLTSILTAQRLPSINTLHRRARRKHFLRARSPTLSPIHESGLSNPASPQLYRHNKSLVSINNVCETGLVKKT